MNKKILQSNAKARKQLKYGTRNLTGRYYSRLGSNDEVEGRRVFASRVAGYKASLTARGRSVETVKTYGYGIRAFGAWLVDQGRDPGILWDFDAINDEEILAGYRTWLLKRFENRATVMQRVCAVNSWLKFLGRQGGNGDKAVLSMAIPPVDTPDVYSLPLDQMRLMQVAARDGVLTNEEAALFWTLVDSWQRVTAVTSLRLRDVDFDAHTMTFRASAEKTRRNLALAIQYDETIDALYRQIEATNLGRDPNAYIFCASRIAFGAGRVLTKYPVLTSHIRRERACEIVRSVARKSKCDKTTVRFLTPHVFRRFAVTQAMLAGALPSEIVSRSGHRDLATMLERYARPTPRSELLSGASYLLAEKDEKVPESHEGPAPVSDSSRDLAKAIEAMIRERVK